MKQRIGKKEKREADDGVVFEVTQEEYDEQKAYGWDDEEILSPGKHIFRRVTPDRVAKPEDLLPSNIKVQITMKVDLDVFNHFKTRATKSNAAPYQTQINAELRKVMERDLNAENSEIGEVGEFLLENESFLRKITERIKESVLEHA